MSRLGGSRLGGSRLGGCRLFCSRLGGCMLGGCRSGVRRHQIVYYRFYCNSVSVSNGQDSEATNNN